MEEDSPVSGVGWNEEDKEDKEDLIQNCADEEDDEAGHEGDEDHDNEDDDGDKEEDEAGMIWEVCPACWVYLQTLIPIPQDVQQPEALGMILENGDDE